MIASLNGVTPGAWVEHAGLLEEAGADGLALCNRFYQPDLDLESMEVVPRLVLSTSEELRLPPGGRGRRPGLAGGAWHADGRAPARHAQPTLGPRPGGPGPHRGRDLMGAGGWPAARPPLFLETSLPGVFAAGDVRHRSVKRVASAVGEGAIAVQLIHQFLAEPR
jgi:hypothetical protein